MQRLGPAHSSSFPNSAQMCRCATCSKYIQYMYDENMYLFPCMYSLCIGQARIQRLVWGPCLLLSKSWPCYLTPGAGVTPCSSSSFPILQGLPFHPMPPPRTRLSPGAFPTLHTPSPKSGMGISVSTLPEIMHPPPPNSLLTYHASPAMGMLHFGAPIIGN